VADNEALSEIWQGDRLNRREEALSIQVFLEEEVREMARQGRGHSYVLAIDAAYGVGKTFFLERFLKQLRLSHPVAHFDAWIDDANEEPLVAIMAAIEDALKPYMAAGATVRQKFRAATTAALPIIGKAVTGAGTAIAKRWMGDTITDAVGEEVAKATGKIAQEASDAAFDGAKEEIETLIDREAQQMLDAYQRRRKSRETFKQSMTSLVASLDTQDSRGGAPLYIVIDELDRCRPDFAIRVLEEIKHFFDVPGVVFVMAIHGDQLSKSIRAVYGTEFDSDAYLRRFFSRRYMLRQPSLIELVTELFAANGIADMAFQYPNAAQNGATARPGTMSVYEYCAIFFDDYSSTSREVIAVVDMIRVFKRFWTVNYSIELPLLLAIIVHRLRDRDWRRQPIESRHRVYMSHPYQSSSGLSSQNFSSTTLIDSYRNLVDQSLPDVVPDHASSAADRYVRDMMQQELRVLHNGQWQTPPRSQMARYEPVVEQIYPFNIASGTSTT